MRNGKRGKYLILLIVFLAGASLSFFAAHFLYRRELKDIKGAFENTAEHYFRQIEKEVGSNIAALYSFSDFYAASQDVDRHEFDIFAQGIFLRQPYIYEFRWLPRVLAEKRNEFELSAAEEGLAGFSIKDPDRDGRLIKAAERSEYFPVYYISHSPGIGQNRNQALGLDSSVIPQRRQAIQHAAGSAMPVLVSESRQYGQQQIKTVSHIYLPIYRSRFLAYSTEDLRDNLVGFVVLVYRIDDLIKAALAGLQPAGADISIYQEIQEERELIYFYPSLIRQEDNGAGARLKEAQDQRSLFWTRRLAVADKSWLIECVSRPEFFAMRKIILPRVIFILGLALVLFLSFYLKNIIDREDSVRLTAEKRSKELFYAQEKYRILYQSSSDAIMTLEPPQWNFTFANPATIKLFAAKQESEFISYRPWDFSPERQPDGSLSSEKAKAMIELAVREGANSFQWQHKKLNQEEFTASVLLSKFEYEGKTLIQATVRDISEAKKAEGALNKAAKDWAVTFDSMADGVSVHSPDFEIIDVNLALCRILDKKKEELIGKKCFQIFHSLEQPVKQCPLEKSKESKDKERVDIFEPTLDKWLSVAVSPVLDDEGMIIKIIHVVRDISEGKKAQERIEKAKSELEVQAWGLTKANEGIKALYKELEARNRELVRLEHLKSEFISTVSHELRTPLTAIKEGIAIVLDGSAGEISEEQKDFLDTAKRNVDRLSRLINDVLDFQKLESGKMSFTLRENDMNALVKEVANTMGPLAKQRGLELRLNLAPNLPLLKFDHDRIIQVLANLVNNAIKFTERGSVAIFTSHSRPEDNFITVSVEDTGPGIQAEDIPRLFQHFEQLEKGGERKTGGTGLGLAISKEIIERHSGRIWAESSPGEGAKFKFLLPIRERRGRAA